MNFKGTNKTSRTNAAGFSTFVFASRHYNKHFRKAHRSLGRSRFWREDIRWHGTSTAVDMSVNSHTLAFCLHGESQNDVDIYVMINAYWHDLMFTIQEGQAQQWKRVIDTSLPSPMDSAEPGNEQILSSLNYVVKARTIVIFIR